MNNTHNEKDCQECYKKGYEKGLNDGHNEGFIRGRALGWNIGRRETTSENTIDFNDALESISRAEWLKFKA